MTIEFLYLNNCKVIPESILAFGCMVGIKIKTFIAYITVTVVKERSPV